MPEGFFLRLKAKFLCQIGRQMLHFAVLSSFRSLAQVEGYGIITQVALGFIAFVIGNEFRLSALKRMGRQALTVGIAQAVITTALVDVALIVLHFIRPDVISLTAAGEIRPEGRTSARVENKPEPAGDVS